MYCTCRSPNHYAHQRTMVVMETVRAATLATARRLERLATEAEKQKQQTSPERKQPSTAKPSEDESRVDYCIIKIVQLINSVSTALFKTLYT